jgi:hypothetical protein
MHHSNDRLPNERSGSMPKNGRNDLDQKRFGTPVSTPTGETIAETVVKPRALFALYYEAQECHFVDFEWDENEIRSLIDEVNLGEPDELRWVPLKKTSRKTRAGERSVSRHVFIQYRNGDWQYGGNEWMDGNDKAIWEVAEIRGTGVQYDLLWIEVIMSTL